jgi:hypothetical protein
MTVQQTTTLKVRKSIQGTTTYSFWWYVEGFIYPEKVKLSRPCAYLIKHYALKVYGGMDVQIHIFLTSALVRGGWSVSHPCCFTPKLPGTQSTGGWVGHRAGLDDLEKRKFLPLQRLELQTLGRPAYSQSLDWLWYPSSLFTQMVNKMQRVINKVNTSYQTQFLE